MGLPVRVIWTSCCIPRRWTVGSPVDRGVEAVRFDREATEL
jgi:hypothetical protein